MALRLLSCLVNYWICKYMRQFFSPRKVRWAKRRVRNKYNSVILTKASVEKIKLQIIVWRKVHQINLIRFLNKIYSDYSSFSLVYLKDVFWNLGFDSTWSMAGFTLQFSITSVICLLLKFEKPIVRTNPRSTSLSMALQVSSIGTSSNISLPSSCFGKCVPSPC